MNNLGPVNPPTLSDVLHDDRDTAWAAFNAVRVGIVKTYNATKQVATVQLVNSCAVWNTPMSTSAIPPDPTIVQYPILVDVPVMVLSGGGSFLSLPIAAGDSCVVMFSDRDLDPWWTNGTQGAPPNSTRMHSLADGIALVGIKPFTSPLPGLSTTALQLIHSSGSSLVIDTTSAILQSSDGDTLSLGGGTPMLKSGVSNGAVVKVDGTKVDIYSSGSTSLGNIINSLINALINWVDTRGDTPNSTTIAALNTVKTNASDLLE